MDHKKEAIHFFELSLKEEQHTVFETADILWHICTMYESLDDGKNISQCLQQLLHLQPKLLNAPPTPILQHSDSIRRIAQFYGRHNKKEEASALDQKIVDSVTGESIEPDFWALRKALVSVKDAFYSKNYSRAVQIGLKMLPHFVITSNSEKVDSRMLYLNESMKIFNLQLEVKVLIGRAKFLSHNFTEGLDYLQTIFESDLMKFDFGLKSQRSVICKYLIFRPRYFITCFPFELHPYSLYQFGKGFLYYGLWYLPNITMITEFLTSHESRHTGYYHHPRFRSQSTDIVSTGDRGVSITLINTVFPWLVNVNETVNNILESSVTSILYIIGLAPFVLIQICCCYCRVSIVLHFFNLWYKYFKVCLFVSVAVFISLYTLHLKTV